MNNTIIGIYGRQNEGKSTTIKNVRDKLLIQFPQAKQTFLRPDGGDIWVTIEINGIKLGIESWGDPSSPLVDEDSLEDLAKQGCNIILCATRTSGGTVKEVDRIANQYDYNTLWLSSYYSPNLDKDILNDMAANATLELVNSLISNKL